MSQVMLEDKGLEGGGESVLGSGRDQKEGPTHLELAEWISHGALYIAVRSSTCAAKAEARDHLQTAGADLFIAQTHKPGSLTLRP